MGKKNDSIMLLQVSVMLHKVWEKKRNLKIAETPKMIGKIENRAISIKTRKTITFVLEVEVITNITHINPLQTKLRKRKGKKQAIFWKLKPYKQRQEEKFETVEIQNYEESQTRNNYQQIEHIIIVSNMSYVTNQTEKNVSNSVRENFFLHRQGAMTANQQKNWLFILRFWIYLAKFNSFYAKC